jgi:hypothetical protein
MAMEAKNKLKYLKTGLEILEERAKKVEEFASVCFLPRVAQEAMSFGELKTEFYADLDRARRELSEEERRYFYGKVLELIHKVDKAIMETFEKCNYSKKE